MDPSRKALEILAAVAETGTASLDPSQDLRADLSIDSPKALKLLMDLEDAFEIEISEEEAARIETVGDVLDLVRGSAS